MWDWFRGVVCSDINIKNQECLGNLKNREVHVRILKNQISELDESIIDRNEVIENLRLELQKYPVLPPEEITQLANEIKNQYPVADISYRGYAIKLVGEPIFKPKIKVQDFIQPIYSHKFWLEEKNLTLKKYLEIYNPETPEEYGELINKLQFDIFKQYAPRKRYKYDKDLYGTSEHWAPSIETWYLKQMDCENSSNELMCLFESAGLVGDLKHFSWNVCGDCKLGGHSTIYCYDFKNEGYRHFETTKTQVFNKDFYSLPKHTNKSDSLNITSVWWSFNSAVARHTFKTDAARKSYEKRERFKNFVIE